MFRYLFLLLFIITTDAIHFNGGTIRWAPVNPYSNVSTTTITVIQSYWWSYPTITCSTDVPISTAGRSSQNSNLTCITDCSTDGGYSTKPVDILTDCTSVSSSLGMMTSQRSINTTLASGAHFYLAHAGSAWVALNDPAQSGLQWSITTSIDLRKRSDGYINTPPIASVASPQYAIVNKTTQIRIPVSDVNAGDDIRCRWSVYTPGSRRRKRWDENEERINDGEAVQLYKAVAKNEETIHIRKKRACSGCNSVCGLNCSCVCSWCDPTVCTGATCNQAAGCTVGATTTTIGTTTTTTRTTTTTTGTTTTTTRTTTTVTAAVGTTTVETPGTLKSTSSYPNRQSIDECGGICYPGNLPSGTTLSNCSLSFTGLNVGTWYGIAIQVEDFNDTTSSTPMSSVPVQFLVYVLSQPICSIAPMILPLTECLEVTVGITKSFNLSVLNLCNPNISDIDDIIMSKGITGMQMANLTKSSINASVAYGTFTWTPQASQIGLQQLCVIAYTSEQVQSNQYCVSFTVIMSPNVCATTTTTTTTTTTGTTATSTTTRTTTTTTSSIVSIISTTTTTTTTSSLVPITSTGVSTTSTILLITSTGATFASILTSTASLTAATKTAELIAQDTSGKKLYWGLIGGLSSLGLLLLLLLCCCCCLYCCMWLPAAKRRRQEEEQEKQWQQTYLSPSTESTTRISPYTNKHRGIQLPKKSYQVYTDVSKPNGIKTSYMIIKNNPVISTIPRVPFQGISTTSQNWPIQRHPVTTRENAQN